MAGLNKEKKTINKTNSARFPAINNFCRLQAPVFDQELIKVRIWRVQNEFRRGL